MTPKIAFLGPRGTFSEEALNSAMKALKGNLVAYPTEQDVIAAVDSGEVDKGIVPIENSIEGSVNITLDMLTFEANLVIEKEVVVSVKHNLIAPKGTGFKDIEKIMSHPQATAQCRDYLKKNFPTTPVIAANSTAEAVKRVAESNQKRAAIGTRLAAEIYGLEVLASDIEDFKDNQTRFIIVGKEPSRRTGHDKTSVVCFIYEDRPGSLLQILQEFAFRYINLTKIQSRPTKEALGDYCFWIDLEGHLEDKPVAEAIECLKCKIRKVKILGSYPRSK